MQYDLSRDAYRKMAFVMRLTVHVHPGSSTTSVGGSYDGALVVHVRARAVDGAANEAVLGALALAFDVRHSAVQMVRGSNSRTKVVDIDGDDVQTAQRFSQLVRQADES